MFDHSPRIGSLFSGYGGLDMGVQAVLGGDVVWHSEIDPGASTILAHHWPDVPNLGDISAVDWSTVAPIDVLTGGFPCQDVSHAGRRAGLIRDGQGRTRSGLWGEMLRAITELRPRLVVAENVRGLLSATADGDVEPCPWCLGDDQRGPVLRALGAVLADLADVGYDSVWCGLRAADLGAAHARFRVFIVAAPADPEPLPRREHRDPRGVAPTPEGRVRADGDQARPGAVRGGPLDPRRAPAHPGPVHAGRRLTDETGVPLLPTPQAADGNGGGRRGSAGHAMPLPGAVVQLLPTPRATDGTKGGPNQHGSAGDLMLPSAVHLLPTPAVADVQGGRKTRSGDRSNELLLNGIAATDQWGDYGPAIARHELLAGRPAPAPTEPGKNGAPRLSPRFVEWLMCLPDGHVTDVPDLTRNQQLKALGNGVVPPQAAAALAWALPHLLNQETP